MMISGQTAVATTTLTSVAAKTAQGASGAVTPPPAAAESVAKPASAAGKKDFATVATEARAAIDAGYQTLGKTGDIHTTAKDWETAFKGMDRRSLYAVTSNAGGHFSKEEQDAAGFLMSKQLEAAMGLDTPGAFDANPAASMKAGVKFLDTVSDEEKQSVRWAVDRASAQQSYELWAPQSGQPPENLDSDNPLVKVLTTAMRASRGDPSRDRSEGRLDTLEGLKNQPWAKGFEAQIDQASRAVARQGSLVDRTV